MQQEQEQEQEHIYNAWLPPCVVEEVRKEPERFHQLVCLLKESLVDESPAARLATTRWIPVITTFVKSKSELAIADLEAVVQIGLDLLLQSSDNLTIQQRWGHCVTRLVRKYHKKLHLEVEWKPFYAMLLSTHFKRRYSYEGLAMRTHHLDCIVALVRCCRRFFPLSSGAEIWFEFRPALDDITHNSALESLGFLSLFLPTSILKRSECDLQLSTQDWISECLKLWASLPNCRYWNLQWASLIARCIKHSVGSVDWEPFLPTLFTSFLRSFEVPVGKAGAWSPVQRHIPHEVAVAFDSRSSLTFSKVYAKSIVYLLTPSGSAQGHLETLVDLLEQFYHPSNGGSWTGSLERLLRCLFCYFLQRLDSEQRRSEKLGSELGPRERAMFVRTLMRLTERGQYSKNVGLANTVGFTSCFLAYVEPALMLPPIISGFQTALESITATHQLEFAISNLALAARPILLASSHIRSPDNPSSIQMGGFDGSTKLNSGVITSLANCKKTLMDAMFDTLPGLDANDPNKTLATLQLYCSVLSSVGVLGAKEDGVSGALAFDWSKWIDEFLSRIFVLLVNLEPSITSSDTDARDRFLTDSGSQYRSVVDILFSRVEPSLYKQALERISKFVHSTVLPGAADEIGVLCFNIVSAHPEESVTRLLVPLMESIVSSLAESPSTGFSGSGVRTSGADFKVGLSDALESTVTYQLNIVGDGISKGGHALLAHSELLKRVIAAAFDAPSSKVNIAGSGLLICLLSGLSHYYITGSYPAWVGTDSNGIDLWYSTKGKLVPPEGSKLLWHLPSQVEIEFAEELLHLHLHKSLQDLRNMCQEVEVSEHQKEHLRVLLLRLEATLFGVGACLPDFSHANVEPKCLKLAGSVGIPVGSPALREEAADTIHQACEYMLRKHADDTTSLSMLVRVIGAIGNYGSVEYSCWGQNRQLLEADAKCLIEPHINFITNCDTRRRRRPFSIIRDKVELHNIWRSSQQGGWHGQIMTAPLHLAILSQDLLDLSLHNYHNVRSLAGERLEIMLKQYPSLVKNCVPKLTQSLQVVAPTEEAAFGACNILKSRSLLRHLMQDWNSMSSFLLALLSSAHIETVKTQNAITELFLWFNFLFKGVPVDTLLSSSGGNGREDLDGMTYSALIAYLKEKVEATGTGTGSSHWRYVLMAHGMLLFLALPAPSTLCNGLQDARSIAYKTRQSIAGEFLNNLTSDLPALRLLSVLALLFLVPSSALKPLSSGISKVSGMHLTTQTQNNKKNNNECYSMESTISSAFKNPGFGKRIVKHLALDHNYAEGQTYQSSNLNDVGLTSLMPSTKREWPYTRTWDSNSGGEQFNYAYAKLFKSLVRECGSLVLQELRTPLEEAANAVEDRSQQCIAAEIISGLLRSDMPCVVEAWHSWLRPLLWKVLLHTTVESACEWAACVRLAVGGKGRSGRHVPVLRSCVLECIAEPLLPGSATSLVSKRLMLLQASLLELGPDTEMDFQIKLLGEVLDYMSHPAPQVRDAVGGLICKLGANILGSSQVNQGHIMGSKIKDWSTMLVESAESAVIVIQSKGTAGVSKMCVDDTSSDSSKEALKCIETALHFVVAAIRSGNAAVLMPVLLRLLQPVLALQDTWDKDVQALAKSTMQLLMWQAFSKEQLDEVAEAVLSAADQSNWHTRVAALTFLSPLVFRHTFVMPPSYLARLWSKVHQLLFDPQVEVRELASSTLAGLMKGAGSKLAEVFRKESLEAAVSLQAATKLKTRREPSSLSAMPQRHGVILGVAACVLSVPYDMPGWLPEMVTVLARFHQESWPIRGTVTKTVSEFRRTHLDTWEFQQDSFTEEQLEVLSDLTSAASYFA